MNTNLSSGTQDSVTFKILPHHQPQHHPSTVGSMNGGLPPQSFSNQNPSSSSFMQNPHPHHQQHQMFMRAPGGFPNPNANPPSQQQNQNQNMMMLAHPGAMPNIRPPPTTPSANGPGRPVQQPQQQPGGGQNPSDYQSMQAKLMAQRLKPPTTAPTAPGNANIAPGAGAPGGAGMGAFSSMGTFIPGMNPAQTPYDQQRAALMRQQQQLQAQANFAAQQGMGGQGQPGQQQPQQQMNGFGAGVVNGVNGMMNFQQPLQHQRMMQPGGTDQIGRPPSQASTSQPSQQQQQQQQQAGINPQMMMFPQNTGNSASGNNQSGGVIVPPSPALSSSSASQRQQQQQQQQAQQSMMMSNMHRTMSNPVPSSNAGSPHMRASTQTPTGIGAVGGGNISGMGGMNMGMGMGMNMGMGHPSGHSQPSVERERQSSLSQRPPSSMSSSGRQQTPLLTPQHTSGSAHGGGDDDGRPGLEGWNPTPQTVNPSAGVGGQQQQNQQQQNVIVNGMNHHQQQNHQQQQQNQQHLRNMAGMTGNVGGMGMGMGAGGGLQRPPGMMLPQQFQPHQSQQQPQQPPAQPGGLPGGFPHGSMSQQQQQHLQQQQQHGANQQMMNQFQPKGHSPTQVSQNVGVHGTPRMTSANMMPPPSSVGPPGSVAGGGMGMGLGLASGMGMIPTHNTGGSAAGGVSAAPLNAQLTGGQPSNNGMMMNGSGGVTTVPGMQQPFQQHSAQMMQQARMHAQQQHMQQQQQQAQQQQMQQREREREQHQRMASAGAGGGMMVNGMTNGAPAVIGLSGHARGMTPQNQGMMPQPHGMSTPQNVPIGLTQQGNNPPGLVGQPQPPQPTPASLAQTAALGGAGGVLGHGLGAPNLPSGPSGGPTPQELIASMTPQQQHQFASLPPQQQQQHVLQMQMQMMMKRQQQQQQQQQQQAAQHAQLQSQGHQLQIAQPPQIQPVVQNQMLQGPPQVGDPMGMERMIPPAVVPAPPGAQQQLQQQHQLQQSMGHGGVPPQSVAQLGVLPAAPLVHRVSGLEQQQQQPHPPPVPIQTPQVVPVRPPVVPPVASSTTPSSNAAAVPPVAPIAPPPANPTTALLPPHLASKVDPRVTLVTPLPFVSSPEDTTHNGALPPITQKEIKKIQKWMDKDKQYGALLDSTERKKRIMKEMNDAAGRPKWWEIDPTAPPPQQPATMPSVGNGHNWVAAMFPGLKFSVEFPDKTRMKRETRRAGTVALHGSGNIVVRKEPTFPKEYKREDSDKVEQLVPIRLELEFENYRLRDTFVWNVNDPVVTPEMFAATTCIDFDIPSSAVPLIVKQIHDQLSEYRTHHILSSPVKHEHLVLPGEDDATFGRGKMESDDENASWWSGWRKRLRTGEAGEFVKSETEEQRAEEDKLKHKEPSVGTATVLVKEEAKEDASGVIDVDADPPTKPPSDAVLNEELRILIKIDILVGSKHLVDQFEWDVNEECNSPEIFADCYANELGLGGEFKTAIAHDIREQVQMYRRSLLVIGHRFDGSVIQDEELRQALLPPLTSVARNSEQAAASMPILNNLSDGEIENQEKEREKDMKRKKRQAGRRRGIALPDRDPVKTARTLPGCADIGLAAAPALQPVGLPSRRAAMIAQRTIADLVAQENSNGYSAPQVHTPMRDSTSNHLPVPVQQIRAKRQKTGHIRPPPLPDTVYKTRSKADASFLPPSTSLEVAPRPYDPTRDDPDANKATGWHCSTCGCPDGIAIGRRKGPKGDKSQCGPCGKFFHRYRRIRDVVYNPDPEYHLRLRNEEEERKRRKRPPKMRLSSAVGDAGSGTPITLDPASPAALNDDDDDDDDDEGPPLAQAHLQSPAARPRTPLRRVRSPVSEPPSPPPPEVVPSPSPPPREPTPPPPTPTPAPAPASPQPPAVSSPSVPPLAPPGPVARGVNPPDTPQWILQCMQDLHTRYPHDKFHAMPRNPQPGAPPGTQREWRIKCHDCPGKVYTPGLGETLSNFEVHLRNKRHRDNVQARVMRDNPNQPTS